MDCEPSTSMEADKNIQHSSMLKNQYKEEGRLAVSLHVTVTQKETQNCLITKFQMIKSSEGRGCIGLEEQTSNQKTIIESVQNISLVVRRPAYVTHLLLWKNYCCPHKQNQEQHISAEIGTAPL